MHLLADFAPAKDHYPEKTGLIHEGGNRLVSKDLPKKRSGGLRERSVENAERHLHRDAGGDTRAEINDEQLLEEAEQAIPMLVIGANPAPFGKKQQDGKPNSQRRVEGMNGRDPGKKK